MKIWKILKSCQATKIVHQRAIRFFKNGQKCCLFFSGWLLLAWCDGKPPVGCCVTQRAVERGGFGWWSGGGIVRTFLWGSGLVLAVWGDTPQTSEAYGKPVISRSRCSPLPVKPTLFIKRIHFVTRRLLPHYYWCYSLQLLKLLVQH